jgi:hypothetical protein
MLIFSQADAVQAAIKSMLDGTLDPSKIKIDGLTH